jgi:Rrf2 family protein
MMISMKTKYALKALAVLAESRNRGALQIAELASGENIPKKFLEAILLTLRNQGVLASKKGPGGGYTLAVEPAALTIGKIVRTFEGDLAPVQCLGDTSPARCAECADMGTCGVRLVMAEVKTAVSAVLDRTTLADMIERSEHARQKSLKLLDYAI